jgi:hypothetical protein
VPVGKLLTGNGTYSCTASVIAGAATPSPTQRALVLTAGHCVEETNDNTVIVDRVASPAWSFTPAYFIDTQARHRSFGIGRVLYATMKRADLAVLELHATYGELAELGVHPLHLMAGAAAPDLPIELVHIPVIGVAENERFLRHSSCRGEANQRLIEGTAPWWWEAAIPNDCAGVAGGTSGSPVFQEGGADVIGVLNTTATPGYVGCGLGRPCELGEDNRMLSRDDTNYAIPVDRIARALRADSTLDITHLDDGRGVTLTRTRAGWSSQRTQLVDGSRVPARWNLHIEDGFEVVRYKTGPASSTDCADIEGYGAEQPWTDQPLRDLALPQSEGVYAACVIGGNGKGIWQSPRHATIRLRDIDETPPTITPPLATREDEGVTEIRPRYLPWEVVDVYVKFGPAADVDCQSADGYQHHISTRWYVVDRAKPWRFCSYGTDDADNAGPVATFDFPATSSSR